MRITRSILVDFNDLIVDLTFWKNLPSNYDMEDARREILTRVARGELTPEEGASLLDELERERSGPPNPTRTTTDERPASAIATTELTKVRVERNFGSVTVIGDPSVKEAVAEGPHRAERVGDLLIIRSSLDDEGGFVFSRGDRRRWRLDGLQSYAPGFRTLELRMNPELALEVVSQAGSVRIQGVHSAISAEVQAGSATADDFRGPLDISVQAGSFRGRGILAGGASHIRSEAGAVRLHLTGDSSVRIRARSTMGRIQLGDERTDDVFVLGGGSRELVLGAGEGTLDLDATMGSVRVTTD
jgi:hypothetical protein